MGKMLRAVSWTAVWCLLTTRVLVGALSTESQPNNCFITQEHQLSAAVNQKYKSLIKDINFEEIIKTLFDFHDSLAELDVRKSNIGGICVSDPMLCVGFGQFYPYTEVNRTITELISPRHYVLYPTYLIQYQEDTAVCDLDSQIGVLGQCRNTLVNIFQNQSFEVPNNCPVGKTCLLGEGRAELKYFFCWCCVLKLVFMLYCCNLYLGYSENKVTSCRKTECLRTDITDIKILTLHHSTIGPTSTVQAGTCTGTLP